MTSSRLAKTLSGVNYDGNNRTKLTLSDASEKLINTLWNHVRKGAIFTTVVPFYSV